MALTKVIEQLKAELQAKTQEAVQINKAIRLLQSGSETTQYSTGRRMSPEAIEKIRAAQKQRWAEKKKAPVSKKGS